MNKNITALMLALALGACSTVKEPILSGVTPVQVPNLPAELSVKAERLPDITDDTMGGQVIAGMESDVAYNDVAHRYNRLQDLYLCVQKSMNTKEDPAKCLR